MLFRSLTPGVRQPKVSTGISSIPLDNPYSWLILLGLFLILLAILADWSVLRPAGEQKSSLP